MRRRTFCGLLQVLFVLLFVIFVQGQGFRQNKADRIPYLSGLIFTENVSFSHAAESIVACAKLCLKTETCTTFTHRKATPTTLSACRGHSGYFTASSPRENIAGTGVYQFREIEADVIETTTEITTLAETTPEITTLAETTTQTSWLLAGCSSDSQCMDTVANTRCFDNQCMCIQGYYYSVSTKACIETCSDLGNTYLHYVSSAMWNNNIREMRGVTVQQCQDDCNADGECLNVEYSVNYYPDGSTCYVQHVSAREKPGDWTETLVDWNFYQRNCQ